MSKIETKDMIASLKEMTILELNELVKAIEEEFGVTAAAPVAVAAAGGAAEAAAPSEVTLSLTNAGGTKIQVIKLVKEVTGLGLKEAKELVDNVPSVIKENIKPEEAEELKSKLMEAGATVEIK